MVDKPWFGSGYKFKDFTKALDDFAKASELVRKLTTFCKRAGIEIQVTIRVPHVVSLTQVWETDDGTNTVYPVSVVRKVTQ